MSTRRPGRYRSSLRVGLATAVVLTLLPSLAFAENKSGVEPQVLSLPKGPGSIEGLGESFEPQLNTGTAAYRVRLAVPPGVAGSQPDLSLVYDGGYGNGPLGLGWRLDLPMVQRQTDKGLPAYTDADTLIHSAAGELVPVGNGQYRAKIEGSFLKVQQDGAGFAVWKPDGTRQWFGSSAETRVANRRGIFEWRLERTEDRNGNAVTYRYLQDGGQLYLSEIHYSAGTAGADKSIHFSYSERPDPVTDYRSRARVVTRWRLTGVEMRSQGLRVRAYSLEYGDATSAPSLLRRVVQVGADGTSTLPPMSFDYSRFDQTRVAVQSMANPPPRGVSLVNTNVDLVDIDGDGLPDLFYTPTGSPHRFWLNQGRGAWATTPAEPLLSPRRTLQSNGVLMADMDGDGRSDLFVKGTDAFGYFRNRGALAWDESDWVNAGPAPRFAFEDSRTRLLDLNSDKLIDVLRDYGSRYLVWLNPGSGTWSADSDHESTGAYLPLDRATVKLGDLNGDRIDDLVYVLDGHCSMFAGMGFGEFDTEEALAQPPFDVDPARLTLTDFDHDGLADWVEVGNRYLRVWRSAGHGGFAPVWLIEGTPGTAGRSAFRFADMDGDGTLDLLLTNEDSAAPYQTVAFNAGVHPNLLTTIRNGLGQETRIEYRSSIEDYLRDRDAGNPWSRKLPFPVQVVSRVTVRDHNSGQEYVTDYRYRDGYYDGAEKEFRGFGQVDKIEQGGTGAPGLVTRFTFDVGDAQESRKGMVLAQALLAETGTLSPPTGVFEVADHRLTTRTLATGTNGVPVTYSFTNQTDTRLYEGTASPVTLRQVWDQDSYGNRIQDLNYGLVDGTNLAAGQDEVLTSTDYAVDLNRWVLDRPSRVRKTTLAGGFVSLQRLTYDTRGNLTLDERSPDGVRFIPVATNAYDGYGNLVKTTDANGHWRALDYDATFHSLPVRETIGGLGLTMTAGYDLGLGLMTAFTDPNGQTTGFGYDTFGRLTRIIKPGDSEALPTQGFEYRLGDPVSAIVTHGREQSGQAGTLDSWAWFDGLGRKLQTRSEGPHGDWVVKDAAVFNQRRGIARQWLPHFAPSPDYADPDPALGHTDFAYDARGRSVRETNPDGTLRSTRYLPLTKVESDEEDNLTGGPHADTPKTLITDGRGRLVEVREQNGAETSVTRYGYDGLDHLTRIRDPQGNVKTLVFDGLGRKTRMDDPDKGAMTYVYDGAGNLVSTTDAKAQTLTYSYDPANRTLAETHGGVAQVRYHYDADQPTGGPTLTNTLGRLAWVEDLAGVEFYTYDRRGNVARQARRLNGFDFITGMERDAMERLTRLTYPDGTAVEYRYNAMGSLAAVPGFVDAIDYAANGQKAAFVYANGVQSRYAYDGRQRLARLRSTRGTAVLQDLAYSYDGASNILRIEDRRPVKTPEDRTTDYGYDDLYRLTQATAPAWSERYRYDSIGNMTFKSDLGVMSYGAGSAGPHALTGAAGISYGYDANGNLATKRGFAYRFDDRDRLAHVDRTTDGAVIDYAYDSGFDRRRKTVTLGGQTQTTLYPDRYTEIRGDRLIKQVFAGDRLIARVSIAPFRASQLARWEAPRTALDLDANQDGIITLDELRAQGANPALVEPGDAIDGLRAYRLNREANPGLLPFATLAAALHEQGALPPPVETRTLFYLPDHLGSASAVMDSAGGVVEESVFYPYGQDRVRTGDYMSEYRFTGKELDVETGLHFFGARYYDSGAGIFLSVDPLYSVRPDAVATQGPNTYIYSKGNPSSLVDSNGLCWGPFAAACALALPVVAKVISDPRTPDVLARMIGNYIYRRTQAENAQSQQSASPPAGSSAEVPGVAQDSPATPVNPVVAYKYESYHIGDHGGQCTDYAKEITDYKGRLGYSLSDKMSLMDFVGAGASITLGNIIVMRVNKDDKIGHVAVVVGFTGSGDLLLSESNWCKGNCERVGQRTMSPGDARIMGGHRADLAR